MIKEPAKIVVAIDSMALVWGIRRQGTPDQLQRARWLFTQLDKDEAQVIVPSIVAAEYLTPLPAEVRPNVLAELTKRFLVKPFDAGCTALAAHLFEIGKPLRPQHATDGRARLRADTMIIATAKTHGALRFYTDDQECRTLASKVTGMKACDFPNMPNDLYEDVK